MAKKTITKVVLCPSCDSEVLAGKFCLECGAVLEQPEAPARISADVIDEIAEAVAKKLEAKGVKDGEEEEGSTGGAGDQPKSKTGLFRK